MVPSKTFNRYNLSLILSIWTIQYLIFIVTRGIHYSKADVHTVTVNITMKKKKKF